MRAYFRRIRSEVTLYIALAALVFVIAFISDRDTPILDVAISWGSSIMAQLLLVRSWPEFVEVASFATAAIAFGAATAGPAFGLIDPRIGCATLAAALIIGGVFRLWNRDAIAAFYQRLQPPAEDSIIALDAAIGGLGLGMVLLGIAAALIAILLTFARP